MALSAAVTVLPTGTLQAGQSATMQVTVTNGNSTPCSLVNASPYAFDTSVGISSSPNTPVGFGATSYPPTKLVGASGSALATLKFQVPLILTFASTSPAYSATSAGSGSPLTTRSFTVGCICYFSDGTNCQATEATVTVKAPLMFNGR